MAPKQTTILAEVLNVDPDHYKPDVAYEFSNGKKMESTDGSDGGIYEDE